MVSPAAAIAAFFCCQLFATISTMSGHNRNINTWLCHLKYRDCVPMERVQSDTASISGSVPETDVVQLLVSRSISSKLFKNDLYRDYLV